MPEVRWSPSRPTNSCPVLVLFLQEKLQTFAFLVFVGVCIAASVYLYMVLPETKNKTFMDISQSFAKINKVPYPSPSHEMEMVLSISPDTKGQIPDAIKVESSL